MRAICRQPSARGKPQGAKIAAARIANHAGGSFAPYDIPHKVMPAGSQETAGNQKSHS